MIFLGYQTGVLGFQGMLGGKGAMIFWLIVLKNLTTPSPTKKNEVLSLTQDMFVFYACLSQNMHQMTPG